MSVTEVSFSLRGWSVICLRPADDQPAAARAIAARGGTAIALPGLRLCPATDAAVARTDLQRALDCDASVFTSPAAVRFAATLLPLAARDGHTTFAVGAGTARALAAFGIVALHPGDGAMHAAGLLALPAFARQRGAIGLVTAPGGRGVLQAGFAARGLSVCVAEVYRRLTAAPEPAAIADLLASRRPRAVLVTSGEALVAVVGALPAAARDCLLDAVAIASSARLADASATTGFATVLQTTSPLIDDLLDALARHAVTSPHPIAT